MGAPAGDFEKYSETTTSEKNYDRPEVKITPNCVDFGDEDEDSAKKKATVLVEAEEK